MLPKAKQWQNWSLPSKYSAIGVALAILGILFSIFQYLSSGDEEEILKKINEEVDRAIETTKENDLQKQNYVNRFIKNPLAEIKMVKISEHNKKPIAYVYYDSEWIKLTSQYSAAIEVRTITDLNRNYPTDEGWLHATLQEKSKKDNIINLCDKDYFILKNLNFDQVYEVRIVDHNYDSDDPPSNPFRFKVSKINTQQGI